MGMLKNIDAKMQVNQDLVRQSAVNSDPVLPTYHLFQNIYQYAIVTLFDYCTTRANFSQNIVFATHDNQ